MKSYRIPGHHRHDTHAKRAGTAAVDQRCFDAQRTSVGGGTNQIPGHYALDTHCVTAGTAADHIADDIH
jgi:hypothetical protein